MHSVVSAAVIKRKSLNSIWFESLNHDQLNCYSDQEKEKRFAKL